ncbi:ABC transporter permease [Catenulispora sp. NF23]|uniref:ABC transporter permease n=1 Tax=Catenulispora pinistramenti TaxID=2705254 RepID=A0ABS5KPS9_9ACTN|nr:MULTISPECIES: ABC transporter permease [Catenulispora]MBS2535577.1 ABC transporter permease [Catenulispora pinistramenti]MBS2548045.1 ABC transporter permease [Catenulispora pinistramenti]
MTTYLIRRFFQSIVTLFIVSIATFGMMHLMPNGVVRGMLGQRATPQTIAELTHRLGLDQPLYVQYWRWLDRLVVHFDLGTSYQKSQTVNALLKEDMGQSMYIVGLALFFTIVISVPVGVLQATRRNSVTDYTITTFSFIGYAIPVFFLGVVLRDLFQVQFHLIPIAKQIDSFHAAFSQPDQMILPVATLVISGVAGYSRYMRSSMLDEITQDYVRTAIAKGATKRRVLYRHVLRNAMIPMITLVGLSLPTLVGGALLVEQIFNIQGIGVLTINAALSSDFVIVLGTTMLTAIVTILGSLVADISYAALDPRVRLT